MLKICGKTIGGKEALKICGKTAKRTEEDGATATAEAQIAPEISATRTGDPTRAEALKVRGKTDGAGREIAWTRGGKKTEEICAGPTEALRI